MRDRERQNLTEGCPEEEIQDCDTCESIEETERSSCE